MELKNDDLGTLSPQGDISSTSNFVTQRISGKNYFLLIASLTLVSLLFIVSFVLIRKSKPTNSLNKISYVPIISPSSSPVTQLNNISSTCVDDKTKISFEKGASEEDGIITITKTNLVLGLKTNFNIPNTIEKNAHFIDINRCFLYVTKGEYPKEMELWKYNFNGEGLLLYKSKTRFDFNVNTSETYLTIFDGNVTVLDISNSHIIRKISDDDIKKHLTSIDPMTRSVLSNDFQGWNTSGTELWGRMSAAAQLVTFWKLNITTNILEVFPVDTVNGSILNPDKEVYAYIDKPLFFDVDSFEEWQKKTPTSSIYIYSLRNKTSTLVDTVPSNWSKGMTTPIRAWDSPTQLRYSTPAGEKVYVLK